MVEDEPRKLIFYHTYVLTSFNNINLLSYYFEIVRQLLHKSNRPHVRLWLRYFMFLDFIISEGSMADK